MIIKPVYLSQNSYQDKISENSFHCIHTKLNKNILPLAQQKCTHCMKIQPLLKKIVNIQKKKTIKSCLLLRRFLLYRKMSHMHNVKTVNTLLPEAPFMLNEEIKSIVHVYTSIVC